METTSDDAGLLRTTTLGAIALVFVVLLAIGTFAPVTTEARPGEPSQAVIDVHPNLPLLVLGGLGAGLLFLGVLYRGWLATGLGLALMLTWGVMFSASALLVGGTLRGTMYLALGLLLGILVLFTARKEGWPKPRLVPGPAN